ncbi:hypothetical protein [Alteromonas oceanisediminis]|uniref:hypothetical protein n=1 Tax=Alteromonas oceanisediminis TaxID=2836180 RepID=UPI001BDA923E|nr:hypothetical protein [Alteromonas oceanisediminis]MBT0587960.1 hypothetical protein [Alteromonas oceanisediminis]
MKKEPPLVLVKTWYELLLNAEDDDSRGHAQKMLLGAFGSEQAVAEYLKLHKII